MNKLVSVVIPTYNRADLIEKAVKSVINQTYKNLEIIIIDDGSTDNTKEALANIKDYRISYYYQENSGGPSKPKNSGIKKAKGDYIAFLDSDDFWLTEKIEKQMEIIDNSDEPNLSIVGSAALIDRNIFFYKKYLYKDCDNLYERILSGNFILSCSSLLIKKELFDNIGLFDENLRVGEDWDFLIKAFKKGYKFSALKDPMFIYRRHGSNITKYGFKNNKISINNSLNVILRYKEEILKHGIYLGMRRMGVYYAILGDVDTARYWLNCSFKFKPHDIKGRIIYLLTYLGPFTSSSVNGLSTVWKYFYFGKYN